MEQGKVRLRNKVADYIRIRRQRQADITVQQLLIHQGGLIPDNALADYEDGATTAMERVLAVDTYVEPGTKFVYTDVGFIVLAEIVQRVSGMNVHEFFSASRFSTVGNERNRLPAGRSVTTTGRRDGTTRRPLDAGRSP
ncbi:MAG: serine hydrolase [Pirellulaceae bacterium]